MNRSVAPHPDQPTVAPEAVEALTTAGRMAIVTDAGDERLAATRQVALELAADHDLDVVLYDRSEETWMEHPHPVGPCDRSDLDERGRGHLAAQLDEFELAGVTATSWIATVPTLTEIVDVIRECGVDLILLPEQVERPKLIDRLKRKKPADIVAEVAAVNLEQPVRVLIHRAGAIELAG